MVNCIMDITEAFSKFIGTHAYIEIALTGKPFIPASWDGFRLIVRNATRFGISSGMFNLFAAVGTLSITILSIIFGHLIITRTRLADHIEDPVHFIVIFAIVAASLADIFMSVWSLVGETLVHCYCVDEELN